MQTREFEAYAAKMAESWAEGFPAAALRWANEASALFDQRAEREALLDEAIGQSERYLGTLEAGTGYGPGSSETEQWYNDEPDPRMQDGYDTWYGDPWGNPDGDPWGNPL